MKSETSEEIKSPLHHEMSIMQILLSSLPLALVKIISFTLTTSSCLWGLNHVCLFVEANWPGRDSFSTAWSSKIVFQKWPLKTLRFKLFLNFILIQYYRCCCCRYTMWFTKIFRSEIQLWSNGINYLTECYLYFSWA